MTELRGDITDQGRAERSLNARSWMVDRIGAACTLRSRTNVNPSRTASRFVKTNYLGLRAGTVGVVEGQKRDGAT